MTSNRNNPIAPIGNSDRLRELAVLARFLLLVSGANDSRSLGADSDSEFPDRSLALIRCSSLPSGRSAGHM